MTSTSSLIVLCVGLVFAVMGLAVMIRYMNESDMKEEEDVTPKKQYIDCHFKDINEFFDDLIGYEFDLYSKYHPELFNSGESYIKPEEMKDLVSKLTSKVFNRITPTAKNNLSLIYNFKTDDELINIIGEKVGILVIGLTAAINNSMVQEPSVLMEDLSVE